MSIGVGRMISIVLIGVLLIGAFVLFRTESLTEHSSSLVLRRVTDSAGRTVVIPSRPQRVIVLNASNLDLFYAAGGTVIGKPTTEALPDAVKAATASVPAVGMTASPDIEKVIALKPDLVLGVNVAPHHQLVPVLEKAGIPILLQALDSYQQILDTLYFYGELTGEAEQAAAAVSRIETGYKQLMDRSSEERPPVKALIVFGSTESFSMATSNSFAGDLLRKLGAQNIADGQDEIRQKMNYLPLSLEYVSKNNPDVILIITRGSDRKAGEKIRAELASHPAWQGLKAVKDNRVHQLPYHLFAVNPGTRVSEALTILDSLIYPEMDR